jgi:two-component system chemotaxis response regulator CheB
MAKRSVPIVILTASPEDGERVMEALGAGAVDFLQKPSTLANDDLFLIRDQLMEKVKDAARASARVLPLPKPETVPERPLTVRAKAKFDVVVLGTSTGGPQALRYLIPQFAAGFPVPLIMVLHMPVGYTASFAEKLAEISALPVKEASDGDIIKAGEVLLAPAGRHLKLERHSNREVCVRLSLEPVDKPHRPSVDVLFQSAAQVYGDRVLGVVMTGMGDDGKAGSAWIKAEGGMVLTESEETCIIYGMPRSVAEAGLSDAAVPLTSLAKEISERL